MSDKIEAHRFAEKSNYEKSLVPTNLTAGYVCVLDGVSHFNIEVAGRGNLAGTRFQFHVMGRTPKERPSDMFKTPQDQLVFTVWNAGSLHPSGRFPEDFDHFRSNHLSAWLLGKVICMVADIKHDINFYLDPPAVEGQVFRVFNLVAPLKLGQQAQKDKTSFKQNLVWIYPEQDKGIVEKAQATHVEEHKMRLEIQNYMNSQRVSERKSSESQDSWYNQQSGGGDPTAPF